MDFEIKGKHSKAVISTLGAQLMSFEKDGKEYIWNGDERYWKGRSPLLFPFVGGLRNSKAYIEGKLYEMPRHGFIRFVEFETVEHTESSVTMQFTSDEESLKKYPFDFTFTASYSIDENDTLKTLLTVKNNSDRVMPFTIGIHTGYAVSNDIYNSCKITFEKPETIAYPACVVETGLIDVDNRTELLKNEKSFMLNHSLFDIDAVTCDNLKSRSLTLESTKSDLKFRIDYPDFRHVIFWAVKGETPYVCIEPVTGLCTTNREGDNFEEKMGMTKLAPNESKSFCEYFTAL